MLLIAFGTRPEWLKVKPIISELSKNGISYFTLFTGQHRDLLNEVKADYELTIADEIGIDRLSIVLASVIKSASSIMQCKQFTYVMVQGDTSSALGVAVSAFNNQIPVIHLEAGLRTHDLKNPFPEEANRVLISALSDYHLCPTISNETNLLSEHVKGKTWVVGNTGLDNLLPYVKKCEYTDKVLVTLHRRENHAMIDQWFTEINNIAKMYGGIEFIIPIHPNPNVIKHRALLTNVKVVDPMKHEDLLNLLVKCKFVITDSGGLQEECSFLGKKTIVCRKETERPEALGLTSTLCDDPSQLEMMVNEIVNDFEVKSDQSPFGDGKSAKKIVKILKQEKII